MDFSIDFQDTVASISFPSLASLEDALALFTQITGSQFSMKKRVLHKDASAVRDSHIVRYATYKCICSFSTDCEAFFNIASKGAHLSVTQSYMLHNHEVVYNPAFKQKGHTEDPYDIRCDLTCQFEEMFPAKSFETFDEFINLLKAFQSVFNLPNLYLDLKQKTGCSYVKRNADRIPIDVPDKQHLIYRAVKMECVHFGYRQDAKKHSQSSRRISCKIGCKSCMHISSCTGRVVILKYNLKHNHPVPIESAIKYPQATHLSANESTDYNVQYDATTQFVDIFASGRFRTYNDFITRLKKFQKETGCMYSKRMSNMWPQGAIDKRHLVYKFVIFDCVHFGFTRCNKKRQHTTDRRTSFCFRGKVGCKSTLRISSIKGYIEIVRYEMRHNHPASQETTDDYLPQTWLLSGIKVGENDGVAFKRCRQLKNHMKIESKQENCDFVHTNEDVDIIESQFIKLKELAMSTSNGQFRSFSEQMSNFISQWKERMKYSLQDASVSNICSSEDYI